MSEEIFKTQHAELKMTRDGSHTLYVPELNEPYHSVNGAIQESECVFINNGLQYLSDRDSISVFELGFGTGLNALLTKINCGNTKVYYKSIEAFPVKDELVKGLNYAEQLGVESDFFDAIHNASWGQDVEVAENFILHKVQARMEDYIFDQQKFQLVYFDAFAPEVHPDLWQPEVFKKIAAQVDKDGVLVTYSAKGIVKQAIRSAGFKVKRLPGPPGKWHVLRGIKI